MNVQYQFLQLYQKILLRIMRHTQWEKDKEKKLKIHAILFSLPTVIANKPTKQETQCRSSQFAFY